MVERLETEIACENLRFRKVAEPDRGSSSEYAPRMINLVDLTLPNLDI
jgi:hypothetical protein